METGNEEKKETSQEQPGGAEEVNFDALAAPEGGYDPSVHNEGGGEGEEEDNIPKDDLPGDLPNLDPDPNDKDGDGGASNVDDPNNEGDPNGDPNEDPNSENDNGENEDPSGENQDPYWMKPFEQIKEANPEWEIPEDVNEENYLAYLQQIFKGQQQELHPEVQRMQEALSKGAKFEEVIESFKASNDLSKLSDRDLMTADYKKNFPDWDEDKIKGVVDKLDNAGMLEVEAGKLRKSIEANRLQQQELKQAQEKEQFEQNQKQIAEERTKAIDQSLKYISEAEDIYGLQISQADKKEFSEYFAKMVTPDEKTGQAPLMDALSDDATLAKIAFMLFKGDEKIKAALTDAKEAGKDSVLNKLDKKPNGPKKGGGKQDPEQIDFDALAAPERIGN